MLFSPKCHHAHSGSHLINCRQLPVIFGNYRFFHTIIPVFLIIVVVSRRRVEFYILLYWNELKKTCIWNFVSSVIYSLEEAMFSYFTKVWLSISRIYFRNCKGKTNRPRYISKRPVETKMAALAIFNIRREIQKRTCMHSNCYGPFNLW